MRGRRVPQPHRPVALPEAMRVPSGLNATLLTARRGRVAVAPICCPVAASHTRTVLSSLPDTIRVPSGLNATPYHRSS